MNNWSASCVAASLGATLLLGCLATGPTGCPRASASDELRLAVEPRVNQPLVADATVELNQAAPVYLEYGNDQVGWLRTPATETAQFHQLSLVRLRPETTYQVRAFAEATNGCPAAVAAASLISGPLPSELRGLEITSTGEPSFPLTLMDYHPPRTYSRWLLALDRQGHVVWYFPIPHRLVGTQTVKVQQLANGNLMYLLRRRGLEEITPDGRIVRDFEVGKAIHHDFVELPDGRLLFLGFEIRKIDDRPNGGPRNLALRGDTIYLLDPQTRVEEEVWNTFEALDPTNRVEDYRGKREDGLDAEDWTHGNTLSFGPRGNLIVSFRHLNQIISLAPDFKTIEWRLGGPDSSFDFPDPTDRFHGQHTAEELPGGRVLMFDNGNHRADGEYSRALEIELDFSSMTARKVWEYRPRPDMFAYMMSSTVRMPNGNTLVNFGFRETPEDPLVLVEARPDGTSAWEQSMRWKGARLSRYRAYPWTSLAGEYRVQPTATNLQ
jgi:hypothetical protein